MLHYDLKDTEGNPIKEENMYKKMYNIERCTFCSNRMVCNGCSGCGDCGSKNVQLVPLEAIWQREDEIMLNNQRR